jgi:hypothetical protein
MVTSFEVAKRQWMAAPTKDEYRPYSGGSLASFAYAMLCGTTTAPTVSPATRSPSSHPRR